MILMPGKPPSAGGIELRDVKMLNEAERAARSQESRLSGYLEMLHREGKQLAELEERVKTVADRLLGSVPEPVHGELSAQPPGPHGIVDQIFGRADANERLLYRISQHVDRLEEL